MGNAILINTGLQPGADHGEQGKPFQRFGRRRQAVETALFVHAVPHPAEAGC